MTGDVNVPTEKADAGAEVCKEAAIATSAKIS